MEQLKQYYNIKYNYLKSLVGGAIIAVQTRQLMIPDHCSTNFRLKLVTALKIYKSLEIELRFPCEEITVRKVKRLIEIEKTIWKVKDSFAA